MFHWCVSWRMTGVHAELNLLMGEADIDIDELQRQNLSITGRHTLQKDLSCNPQETSSQ